MPRKGPAPKRPLVVDPVAAAPVLPWHQSPQPAPPTASAAEYEALAARAPV